MEGDGVVERAWVMSRRSGSGVVSSRKRQSSSHLVATLTRLTDWRNDMRVITIVCRLMNALLAEKKRIHRQDTQDWTCQPAMSIDVGGPVQLRLPRAHSVKQSAISIAWHVTKACHWTRFSSGWRRICLDSHERHPASFWRFSAILTPDINVTSLLSYSWKWGTPLSVAKIWP